MTRQRPRQLVHGGRVLAHALFVDPNLVGEREARRRCLRAACDGARIDAIARGYVVHFASPRPTFAAHSDGLVLTRSAGVLAAAPLAPESTDADDRGIALVRDGCVEFQPPATPVDVSTWLDVGTFRVADVHSLGEVPVVVSATPPRNVPTDVRTILGASVPKPAPEVSALLSAMQAATGPGPGPPRGLLDTAADTRGAHGGWRGWLARLLSTPLRALPDGGGTGSSGRGAQAGPSQAVRPKYAPPREPGAVGRWVQRWLLASPIADMIGRKQAQYIRRTLEMFERGDLNEALRHAIPMAGSDAGPSLGPSLRVPTPRDGLSLSDVGPAGPATSLGLGEALHARFQSLYRRAASELEAQGRIEEAAYVLFELLGDSEDGVAMLERHALFALAAQMADRHEMAPGLVVRLWVLAKQPVRAARVARRSNAFGEAVERLQTSHPDLATHLRILWADWLASGGDYAAAVDAVWPAPPARHLAQAWLGRAIAFGGPLGMRMLVKKLELLGTDEDAREAVRDAMIAVITADGRSAARDRLGLMEHLTALASPPPPLAAELTRAVVRAVLVDCGACVGDVATAIRDAGALLAYDAGRLNTTPVAPAPKRSSVLPATERGLMRVHDAVVLRNGKILCALGEAGLRLLGGGGRPVRRYQHPATRIAINPQTTRAITAIERGETWSLHRIDLTTGKAEAWCEARIVCATQTLHDSRWFIAERDAVCAIDSQAAGFEALWRVGQLPGPVCAIACDEAWLAIVLGAPQPEIWRYALTSRGPVLRSRVELSTPDIGPGTLLGLRPSGAALISERQDDHRFKITVSGTLAHTNLVPGPAVPVPLGGDGFGIFVRTERGLELQPLNDATPREPILTLGGTTHAQVRRDPNGDTVTDDLGRIVVLGEDHTVARCVLVH